MGEIADVDVESSLGVISGRKHDVETCRIAEEGHSDHPALDPHAADVELTRATVVQVDLDPRLVGGAQLQWHIAVRRLHVVTVDAGRPH